MVVLKLQYACVPLTNANKAASAAFVWYAFQNYNLFQDGFTTAIFDVNTGEDRPFTYDYSFWSHDEFRVDENGIMVPTSSKYADQQFVYNALGKQVLDNAWEGYNCCLFAYG